MKKVRIPKVGEFYKLKSTPISRDLGMLCSGSFLKGNIDTRIWVEDVGEIVLHHGNGWDSLSLLFSRGRKISIAVKYLQPEETEWQLDEEYGIPVISKFKRVKKGTNNG